MLINLVIFLLAPPPNVILPAPIVSSLLGPAPGTQAPVDLSKPPPLMSDHTKKPLTELEMSYYNLPAGLLITIVEVIL
jgi:hypothetical protein